MSFVFVNGVLSGVTDDPDKLVKEIIEDRRQSKIPKEINVCIHIFKVVNVN